MSKDKEPANDTAPQVHFHKCCGKCPEAREAAATGGPVKPHTPCHQRRVEGKAGQKPKP